MNPFQLILELFQHCEARGTDLLVLVAMACHADMGNCYLSQEELGRMVNLSPRHVRRVLEKLMKDGYLTVLKPGVGRGNYTGYHINVTACLVGKGAIPY